MIRMAVVTVALVLAISTRASAHQLDEYLQATRVAVGASGIVMHLDLTPGVGVAAEILALLDGDGDGRVSPVEAEAYGHAVLADVSARLDGNPLGLTLTRVEVPTEGELRDGAGTIRIDATGASHAQRPGPHRFEWRNSHRPEGSVYLANALEPRDPDIRVVRQQRDATQQSYSLEYEVRPSNGAAVGWLIAAAATLMVHTRWRKRPRPVGRETS